MSDHSSQARKDPRHLFACDRCRLDARVAAAWRQLPDPRAGEAPEGCEESFVARVVASAREARERAWRRGVLLAAAAALLFSFFAGLGQESGSSAPAFAAEEPYAALAAPDDLGSLVPN